MVYEFGRFTLDEEFFELRRGGELVLLERRVLDLVLYLIRNRDRVVSKDELFREIWSGRVVSGASLSVAMTAARKALRDSAAAPVYIATHHGRGYRFVAPVVTRSRTPHDRLTGGWPAAASADDLFVGREAELGTFSELLSLTHDGPFRLATIGGEPGIGKTHLLRHLASLGELKGYRSAVGRCLDEPGAPPLWPWIQALRRYLPRDLKKGDRDPNSRPGSEEIADLLPELGLGSGIRSAREKGEPHLAQFRLHDAVATTLEAFSEASPLLLVFDDLHRADEASLNLLSYLALTATPSRVLVVASFRNALTSHHPAFSRTLGAISKSLGVRALELRGLSMAAAGELVLSVTGCRQPEESVRSLVERSGGNPFFLKHLARYLSRDQDSPAELDRRALPPDLITAIAASLDDVPEATRELLATASVIGTHFSMDLLAELTGCRAKQVLVDLQPALDNHFLALEGRTSSYRFTHSLVRDGLYQRLRSLRRANLHRACADALASAAPAEAGPHLPAIAHHYFEAISLGTTSEALDYSLAAARWASSRFSYEDAAELYSRALDLVNLTRTADDRQRCEILIQLGSQQMCAGSRAAASETFAAAARIARELDAGTQLARSALALAPGVLSIETGVVDADLIDLLEAALEGVCGSDVALEARIRARLSIALHWTDDSALIKDLVDQALALAATSGCPETLLYARHAQWFAAHGPSATFNRLDLARGLVRDARRSGDTAIEIVCRLFLLGALLEVGGVSAFEIELSQYASLAEETRQPQVQWYVPMLRGARALRDGKLAEAADLRDRFHRLGEKAADANADHSAMAHSLLILHELDRVRDALPVVTNAVERYPAVPGWRATRAWILAQLGSADAARRDIDVLARNKLEDLPERLDWHATMALLSEAVATLNHERCAEYLYEKLLPLADKFFVVGLCVLSWGSISRNLGLLAQTLGDWGAAKNHFEHALESNAQANAIMWKAQTQLDLARFFRSSPHQDLVRAGHLRMDALDTATRLQWPRLIREAHELPL